MLFAGPKCRQKQERKEDLENALQSIRNGELSYKRASRLFRIPRSTLIARLKGWKNRAATKGSKPGRSTDLSAEIEADLANNLNTLNKWGFGLARKEILSLVGTYVKENKIATRFKNGIPGKDWFIGFCKRHNLSCKKPVKRQSIRTERTTPEIIQNFFLFVRKYT